MTRHVAIVNNVGGNCAKLFHRLHLCVSMLRLLLDLDKRKISLLIKLISARRKVS